MNADQNLFTGFIIGAILSGAIFGHMGYDMAKGEVAERLAKGFNCKVVKTLDGKNTIAFPGGELWVDPLFTDKPEIR